MHLTTMSILNLILFLWFHHSIEFFRYYPALKTLEQLEQVHLPQIANYRFSLKMRESIPHLRESIKEAAMSDLKDFLENIRKFSEKIGEVAMRHTSEQLLGHSKSISKKERQYSMQGNNY